MGLTVFQVLEPPRMSTTTVKPSSRTSSLEREKKNIRYQLIQTTTKLNQESNLKNGVTLLTLTPSISDAGNRMWYF